jgi:hypothetical protein
MAQSQKVISVSFIKMIWFFQPELPNMLETKVIQSLLFIYL